MTTKGSVEWVTDASIEPGKLFTLLCSPKAQIDSRLRGAVLNRIRFRVGKNSIDATIRFNEDRANTRDLSHTAARPGHLSARALSCVPLDTIIVAAVLARSDLEGCAAPPGSSRLSSSRRPREASPELRTELRRVTIAGLASNTTRRVVGQWGGAGGASCEDHFALRGELLGCAVAFCEVLAEPRGVTEPGPVPAEFGVSI